MVATVPSTIEVSMDGSGKVLGIGLHTIVIQKFWGGAWVGCACGTAWNKGVMSHGRLILQ